MKDNVGSTCEAKWHLKWVLFPLKRVILPPREHLTLSRHFCLWRLEREMTHICWVEATGCETYYSAQDNPHNNNLAPNGHTPEIGRPCSTVFPFCHIPPAFYRKSYSPVIFCFCFLHSFSSAQSCKIYHKWAWNIEPGPEPHHHSVSFPFCLEPADAFFLIWLFQPILTPEIPFNPQLTLVIFRSVC